MVAEAEPERRWWKDHDAYLPLVRAFKGSTASPEHLAFLALTSLRAQGYNIDLIAIPEDVR